MEVAVGQPTDGFNEGLDGSGYEDSIEVGHVVAASVTLRRYARCRSRLSRVPRSLLHRSRRIYSGANDDDAGTAAILELARAAMISAVG